MFWDEYPLPCETFEKVRKRSRKKANNKKIDRKAKAKKRTLERRQQRNLKYRQFIK